MADEGDESNHNGVIFRDPQRYSRFCVHESGCEERSAKCARCGDQHEAFCRKHGTGINKTDCKLMACNVCEKMVGVRILWAFRIARLAQEVVICNDCIATADTPTLKRKERRQ